MTTRISSALMLLAAAFCFTQPAAYAASVVYTFSGTTLGSFPTPSHTESFRLTVSDFLPLEVGGPVVSIEADDPGLQVCEPCTDTSVPVLHFLRSSGSDLVQFVDRDGATRLYSFAAFALTNPSSYDTLFGINVNRGTLTVESVPEPSTLALTLLAAGCVVLRKRARRGSAPVLSTERHNASIRTAVRR